LAGAASRVARREEMAEIPDAAFPLVGSGKGAFPKTH
jgi:hypothetical protein